MLRFIEDPSNSEETALEIMRLCIATTTAASAGNLPSFFGPIVADNLLFLRMCKIKYNALPGRRNAEIESLILGMGYFHAEMSLFHVAKSIVLTFSWMLWRETAVFHDALIEGGNTVLDSNDFLRARSGATALLFEEICATQQSFDTDCYPNGFNLKVDTTFFTSRIACTWEKIVAAFEAAMSDISEPNTRFVCMSILNLLIPPVMNHFLGAMVKEIAHGQTREASSYLEFRSLPRSDNEKCGTRSVRLMFERISGRRRGGDALLNDRHREMEKLTNVLTPDRLSVSERITEDLLSIMQRGFHVFF
eukprot:IDg7205t1